VKFRPLTPPLDKKTRKICFGSSFEVSSEQDTRGFFRFVQALSARTKTSLHEQRNAVRAGLQKAVRASLYEQKFLPARTKFPFFLCVCVCVCVCSPQADNICIESQRLLTMPTNRILQMSSEDTFYEIIWKNLIFLIASIHRV